MSNRNIVWKIKPDKAIISTFIAPHGLGQIILRGSSSGCGMNDIIVDLARERSHRSCDIAISSKTCPEVILDRRDRL